VEPAERLWDFLGTSFQAADIADPLLSFDAETEPGRVRTAMVSRGQDVAGIREGRLVTRYRRRDGDSLGDRGNELPIRPEQVVHGETPLHLVISRLADELFLFVRTLGEVNGVIRPAGCGCSEWSRCWTCGPRWPSTWSMRTSR